MSSLVWVEIDRDAVINADLDGLALELLEPGEFSGNVIEAGQEKKEGVIAGVVGVGFHGGAGPRIDGADANAGDGGTAGIQGAAGDGSAGILGIGCGQGQTEEQNEGC